MIPAGAQFAPKAAEKTACQFIEIDEPLLPAPSRRSRWGGYEPPAGARCAPLRKGAPLRRRAARLPLLPAPSRRSRRSGYEPPAGHMICAPTKGGPAAPQGCTTAAAARPAPAVSQGRLSAARRAHYMRPYERGPRCAAGLHGCRCCPPCPGGAVGAAISRPPGVICAPTKRGSRRGVISEAHVTGNDRIIFYSVVCGRLKLPAGGLFRQTKAACQVPSIDTPLF